MAAAVREVEPVREPARVEMRRAAVVEVVDAVVGLVVEEVAGLAVDEVAERVVAEPLVAVVLGVVETATLGFGGVEVVDDTAGLRAAAAVVVVVFAPELLRIEARLALEANGFFSSTEDAERWDAALEVVGPVALDAGLRTTEPAAGLVGGLLRPPLAERETDEVGVVLAVEAAADLIDDVDVAAEPRRFGGTAVRLAGTASFFTATFRGLGVSFSVSTSETSPVVSSPAVSAPDASGAPSS